MPSNRSRIHTRWAAIADHSTWSARPILIPHAALARGSSGRRPCASLILPPPHRKLPGYGGKPMSAQADTSRSYARLTPGDPAPWFHQRATSNPNYAFDTAAGRYVVLCFYASAGDAVGRAAIQSVLANRKQFDDERCCFFGVSLDPRDEAEGRVHESLPGIRFFWDADGTISRLYGAVPKDAKPGESAVPARRFWMVLDPTLRVLRVVAFAANDSGADSLLRYLEQLPPPERFAGIEIQAPILFLPNVFEPEFCRDLIRLHDEHGGKESGFMRDVEGKTVEVHDYGRKRRSD